MNQELTLLTDCKLLMCSNYKIKKKRGQTSKKNHHTIKRDSQEF
jgi:hypothetical protein